MEQAWKESQAWKPDGGWQHPERPLPLYVRDRQSYSGEEMVAWVEQEIGNGEDLAAFATKFVELFPEDTEKY